MPAIGTRAVRAASSAADALRQMLAGSGFIAVETGPSSFRIERQSKAASAPRLSSRPAPVELVPPEIIVTGFKRPQPLSTLPATDHVIRAESLDSATGLPGSETLSREVPSLTETALGPGRNRLFLRGIGDGPLNGFSQGSVATLLDDARLNYDAPDPDWALVDVNQVEILEGPQGPLYGTGALGGIVKISTNAPGLDRSTAGLFAGLSATQDGGVSDTQSLVLNFPLVQGKLGMRAVGYRDSTSGWIDTLGGRRDSNSERLMGERLAIRWFPAGRWVVDIVGAVQNRRTGDSQYVDGRLGPLLRPDRLQEPSDLDARVAMITVGGPVGGLEATSVSSISRQEAVAAYDATPVAALLGANGPTLVRDDRRYQVLDQEFRLRNSSATKVEWIAGVSLVKATTDAAVVATDPSKSMPLLSLKRSVTEDALFGEGSVRVLPHLKLGAGARIFSTVIDDEGHEGESSLVVGRRAVRPAGDLSVTWTPAPGTTAYLRAATGYRPGGINPEPQASQASYAADELAALEAGFRFPVFPNLSLDTTLYASNWQHVQIDELLPKGLVATRNAGNARTIGMEAAARWVLPSNVSLSGSIMVQSARLEASGEATGIEDPRLPAVPQTAGRLSARRVFRLGRWTGDANLGLRYVGATHMSFDPTLDRRTGAYVSLDAELRLSRDAWDIAVSGDNLTNSREDRFSFGNPFRVRTDPQRTPARPLTVAIKLGRSF